MTLSLVGFCRLPPELIDFSEEIIDNKFKDEDVLVEKEKT
jgi:hypothetical protein